MKFLRKAGRQNSAVLKLSVTSARAQDVLMQKDLLIEKLNQFMGFNSIEDIQLQHRPHQAIRNQIERQAIRPRPLAKEQKEEEGDYRKHSFSSFKRSWTVPEGTVAGDVSAEYKDGILSVTVKKPEVQKIPAQEIDIT